MLPKHVRYQTALRPDRREPLRESLSAPGSNRRDSLAVRFRTEDRRARNKHIRACGGRFRNGTVVYTPVDFDVNWQRAPLNDFAKRSDFRQHVADEGLAAEARVHGPQEDEVHD